ncbi:MAG: hypothetical protein DCC43_00740 [Candidatus Brocadia sp.]|uniref:Beta-ketoacyl synthase-like N-terminal domain-containing protein n=1 Tax=Candidatus Brocadia fulgida TaxID=380242 RepID=A0A0M2UVH9_9BACT|nr:MAG: hypothetical protein BROFUL_02285 [Candidatus Brocadia fulgida]MBV6518273.1 hypothetical protein [Candidatus Brocadia fulgida]MCE7910229.1 hypothetical protein [Candidatus Brocadia sp. AMX3]MDG5997037.1 hypothetical protein [Candidatus Brocadia sp.]RIK03247.1 MAG: hypothetical protein DCC43_00740 [Candidatus Brocadia sp.]
MKPVITGVSKISSNNIEYAASGLKDSIRQMRFVNSLEQLAVTAVGIMLNDAKIDIPIGNSNVGLFVGIDDSIEDIKDEYFEGILNEGILGASPLLFPYTTPNSLAAQVSIAFDIRGENITIPIQYSYRTVLEYAVECITEKYTGTAIAGGIRVQDKNLSIGNGRYVAEFFLLEDVDSARKRGATIYNNAWEGLCESF